jgi:hypothetical protein
VDLKIRGAIAIDIALQDVMGIAQFSGHAVKAFGGDGVKGLIAACT